MGIKNSPVWAITSYFNPTKNNSRRLNYHQLCAALRVPLITAELSLDNSFDLSRGDADILIQLSTSTVLWHKESLLNVAIASVPSDVPYVAWLDCDIIFDRDDWVDELVSAFQSHCLIQLFRVLKDLGPEESLRAEARPTASVVLCSPAIHHQIVDQVLNVPKNAGDDRAVAAAHNACVVEVVTAENLSTCGPGHAAFDIRRITDRGPLDVSLRLAGGESRRERFAFGLRMLTITLVRTDALAQFSRLCERLDHRMAIQSAGGSHGPFGVLEDNIAIEPRHLRALFGKGPKGHVEQSLLLPHHVAARHLNQDIGVGRLQSKSAVKRQFNRDQRHRESAVKRVIVFEPPAVATRIEVGRDRLKRALSATPRCAWISHETIRLPVSAGRPGSLFLERSVTVSA